MPKTDTQYKEKQVTAEVSKEDKYYHPDTTTKERILKVYEYVDEMVRISNLTYKEFNNRTLKTFIDDGDLRLNAFVMPKDSYDPPKEEWQSNLALPTIRDKQMKILAGFALNVPDMEMKVYGEDYLLDTDRGYMAKWLTRGSYLEEENITVSNFWSAWENASRGTIVEYEGYIKTRIKQKFIKSYDIVTGHVEIDEREIDVDDQCFSFIVPLTEFYISDYYVHDVQEQDRVAWIRYYSKDRFEYEFGKYPDAKYVLAGNEMTNADVESEYHKTKWGARVTKEQPIEVVRFYCQLYDEYVILANGVLLLDAPLLWSVNGKKKYPFAKTIWSPFATKHFFYGNSFPNLMMSQYDNYNTLWNTLHDKEFRSLVPAILVGNINKDAFDLEDEWLTGTTKISVADVSQVKVMEQAGVSNADVLMIKLVAQNLEESAPSLPSLMGNKKATAREIVLADEKLQEMKTVYNEMLTDLWRQKYELRFANIQMNYPQPRKVVDDEGKEQTVYRTYVIDNAELDPTTGEMGVLAIQFRDVSKRQAAKIKMQVSVEEQQMTAKGVNYRKIIIPRNFFDSYTVRVQVIPESIMRVSQAKAQASILEEIQTTASMFPEMFVVNQKEYYTDYAKAYGRNPGPILQKVEQYQKAKKAMQDQLDQQAKGGGNQATPPGSETTPPPADQGQGGQSNAGANVQPNA